MPVTKLTAFLGGAIGNIYRVSLNGVGPDGDHVNTFYLRQVVSSFSGSVFDDIVSTFDATIKADYLDIFPSSYALESIRVAQVDDALKGLPSQTTTSTGPGTRTPSGDQLPGQLAALAEFNSGFSGRKLRGRNFIGVLHEGDQNAGILDSTVESRIQDWLDTMLAIWVSGSAIGEWVVFAKGDNQVAKVVAVGVKAPIYTQRRRRKGVGA